MTNSTLFRSAMSIAAAAAVFAGSSAVAQQPAFRGNVAFVGTKDFYRSKEQSPSGQAYHWNKNAETYYLIGESMGKAMLQLEAAARTR